MKYYVKTEHDPRSLGCTIQTGADLAPEIEGTCPLLTESVVYGVCRYLRKSTVIRDTFIPLSYFYRLPHKTPRGARKIPRSRTLWVEIPAEYLTLRDKKVRIKLLIAGDGITVSRILISNPQTPFSPLPWEKVYTVKT